MENKNLITFLQTKGEIDSNEICLNRGDFDAGFIRDNFGLIEFESLTIFHNHQKDGELIIDVMDGEGDVYRGLNLKYFRPYKEDLNKEFQAYLRK
jgi:uncharacterized protein (DUF779 family)